MADALQPARRLAREINASRPKASKRLRRPSARAHHQEKPEVIAERETSSSRRRRRASAYRRLKRNHRPACHQCHRGIARSGSVNKRVNNNVINIWRAPGKEGVSALTGRGRLAALEKYSALGACS